ncbi:receptor-like serine/threonine-protein kinase SD1-8-like protein [Trifolium pratense]|uniref:Receptor-like serine/threonine-protein kinase SD1-8-like protein n=1 Tax=Trifolium pratense TaxID=57577 RepID=A0A2K3N390_TRIPR|nr:receptor-like serine/threonine-protein kinase SD1-8-like protein [Trifolium pratense]
MQGLFFFLFMNSLSFLTTISTSTDTLTSSQILRTSQTLESSNETFVLGFIPGINLNNFYLAIWYKNSQDTVVWVANRDNPLQNNSTNDGFLKIGDNGNIVLLNSSSNNNLVWSSNQTTVTKNQLVLQLLDNGNLVLRETNVNDPTKYLWQSFDFPTDTLLPSMNLGWNFEKNTEKHLTSWKITGQNPSTGDYSYKIDFHGLPETFLVGSDRSLMYRGGPWNGETFSGLPEAKMQEDTDSIVFNFSWNEHGVYYSFSTINGSIYSRLVLNSYGQLQHFTWNQSTKTWSTKYLYVFLSDDCDQYRKCGPYSICGAHASPVCKCMKGFVPKNERTWNVNDFESDGCVRKTNLDCKSDEFYQMVNVKLPETTKTPVFVNTTMGIKECGDLCRRNCSCTGYANIFVTNGGSGCVMWFGELVDIINYTKGGQDLYIRQAYSKLGTPSSPEFGASSGIKWFQSPPNAVAGDRIVVLPAKLSVNHH